MGKDKIDVNKDYTEEQHLIAAVGEYKKLEDANQKSMEMMYGSLQSPFKISGKPCEMQRVAVVKCYERVRDASAAAKDANSAAGGGSSSDIANDMFPPLQACYGLTKEYDKCVQVDALAHHTALAAAFDARHSRKEN